MLRSLVGSEMCIRDSINAEYGDSFPCLMAEEDIFAPAHGYTSPSENPGQAKQVLSSISSFFTKCVPANAMGRLKARFSRSGQGTEPADQEPGMYHQFPDMNTTSTGVDRPAQPAFVPPRIPDAAPPAKAPMAGDDEWAESLARRASYEIDRVREDTRRRAHTMPESGQGSNYALQ
eukprot:TRINITY_DN15082_c0_g1_i5.p1 TRINITY_DN15082_c0_g1~~TRINITY_DN15082_c0_g1_i5.p1  ORF type:complete len:176 (+),score=42.31 TRINITY_DN15082_c0_g1_i5:154-681(+)